ncbi:hypothetical protein [Comamonas koreensis]|uniref:hypothetical protein n=1 Tax=Comamonas koreensis TaxID=160825 RepID=UPI0015F8D7E2|nr:hypothetical protein [Comamonas koreensis]
MSDLSNMRRLARGQAAWDAMEPDYDDPPVPMSVHMELVDKFFKVRDQLAQLLEEARDGGETLNRIRCCSGDRLLRLCNEIEGIEDDE